MKNLLLFLSLCIMVGGCTVSAREGVLDPGVNQLGIRQMQTRSFDTLDKQRTMQAVIATLQDMGLGINEAAFSLGNVSASGVTQYATKIMVTVMPRGKQMIVRVNAQQGIRPVTNPAAYQQFFQLLSKSMFLEANMVD